MFLSDTYRWTLSFVCGWPMCIVFYGNIRVIHVRYLSNKMLYIVRMLPDVKVPLFTV